MRSLKNIIDNPLRCGLPVALSFLLWCFSVIMSVVIYHKYYHEFTPYWPAILIGLSGQLSWILLCFKDLTQPRIWQSTGSNYPSFMALYPGFLVAFTSLAFKDIELFPNANLATWAFILSVLLMFVTDFTCGGTKGLTGTAISLDKSKVVSNG